MSEIYIYIVNIIEYISESDKFLQIITD